MKKNLALISLALILSATAMAQQPYQGLSVGQPKFLDPLEIQTRIRALTAKLRSLNFIDQTSLTTAVGKIQGAESEARALQINANLMLPYTLVQDILTTTTETGKDTTAKDVNTKTTSQDKPTATAGSATASAKDLSSVQMSARDLQREQIQLEISNLVTQLSLVRSLGDRYLASGLSRQRVVLAIPLSVEPKFNNAVADFEIKIRFGEKATSTDFNQPGVQIIGLFPDSTSYNKQVYTQSSAGFSGSALVQPLGLGVGSSTDRKTSYLVQDKDLIAYEIGNCNANEINLKYEIRPILTQKTVDPGRRVVLIDLSLPTPSGDGIDIHSDITSYWNFYDRGRARTTGEIRDTKTTTQQNFKISLPSEQALRNLERPSIENVDLIDIGSDKILVDVHGDNFLDGCTAIVGSTVFVQPEGASSQNENHIGFVASIDDVVAYGGRVIGPFGDATILKDSRKDGWNSLLASKESFVSEGVTPTGAVKLKAVIKLTPPNNSSNFLRTLHGASPNARFQVQPIGTDGIADDVRLFVRGKSHVYGTTLRPIDSSVSSSDPNTLILRFTVSRTEALNEEFTIFRPFKEGAPLSLERAEVTTAVKPSVDSVSVVSAGENVVLAIKGTQLSRYVQLLGFDAVISPIEGLVSPTSLVFTVPAAQIKNANNLAFRYKDDVVGMLPFDGKKLAPPPPKDPDPTVPTMADQEYGGKRVIAVKLPSLPKILNAPNAPKDDKFLSATLDGEDLVLSKAVLAGSKDLKDVIHIDLSKIKKAASFDIQFKTEGGQTYIGTLKVVAPTPPTTTPATGGKTG